MEATIKLFRALPINKRETKTDEALMKRTIPLGFVFAPEVIANYTNYNELVELVTKTVGLSGEQMNSTFHKSWAKVRDASIEQLVIEQIMHYFTTYGFEAFGIDSDYVYIPDEALNVPKVKLDKIKLTVIKGYTKEELTEKLIAMLESGIALHTDTIKAVVEVALFVDFTDFEKVKNKEVKIMLYEYAGLIPKNPTELLRYAIYKATGKTLLIKSRAVIQEIKSTDNLHVTKIFTDYEKQYGLQELAKIFYRFKPLFLAFRTNQRLKTLVNKVRRLAPKHHTPLPEDYLNLVTAKIAQGTFDHETFANAINDVNVFRKIRLAYALKFRLSESPSILYRIRNGRGYAKSFSFIKQDEVTSVLDDVMYSIVEDIAGNVEGKKVYIPDTIHYALPATEKQFTGNLPSGSYVELPTNMVAGVYWKNVDGHRIDLDLSLVELNTKFGWDASYRYEDRVLFSGDLTDARNGATELYYVKKQKEEKAYLMYLNYFNYNASVPVPFKILVASNKERLWNKRTVDPNNVEVITNSTQTDKQKMLGLLVTGSEMTRFYFAETNLGRSITSRSNDYSEHSRQWLINYYKNPIDLAEVLSDAGAEMVDSPDDADIDLSPETIEKDTFISLLR